MTLDQVRRVADALAPETARDRFGVRRPHRRHRASTRCRSCASAARILKARPKAELLWASPRELLNIFQADEVGCHIITVHQRHPQEAVAGRQGPGRLLAETVKMFYKDARAAGFTIRAPALAE